MSTAAARWRLPDDGLLGLAFADGDLVRARRGLMHDLIDTLNEGAHLRDATIRGFVADAYAALIGVEPNG